MTSPTSVKVCIAFCTIGSLLLLLQLTSFRFPSLLEPPLFDEANNPLSKLHCHGTEACFPSLQQNLVADVQASFNRCHTAGGFGGRFFHPKQPPRFATLTAQFGEPEPHYARALRTHLVQNVLHDTEIHVLCTRIVDALWNKPAFILSVLLDEMAKPPQERREWLLWVDRDSIVLDTCRSPASFLPPRGHAESKTNLLVTKDWNGLNNGVFLLRVSRWSVDLFDAILSHRYYRPDAELRFTEQSAMALLLEEEQFRSQVTWVPQEWFNAYPGPPPPPPSAEPAQDVQLESFQAREGDFLVHFAGVGGREEAMLPWLEMAEHDGWPDGSQQRDLDAEIRDFWTITS